MKRRDFLKKAGLLAISPLFTGIKEGINGDGSVKITFGGDVCLSSPQRKPNGFNFEYILQQTEQNHGKNQMHKYCFEKMDPIFHGSDIIMVNLECPITDSNKILPKQFNFKANPDYANILTEAGINIVTLANNHVYDFSSEGLEDTIDNLDQKQIYHVGAGTNLTNARKGEIISVKGLRFGFLGYNHIGPSSVFASDNKGGTAPLEETIYSADIKELKDNVDFVIVNVHWGVERSFNPQDYQKYHGHKFIDYGADVVIGHHPHVIQPITSYKDGLIFYSLGNFMFGGNSTRSLVSITETFTSVISFSSKGISYDYVPVRITSRENPYQPFEHDSPKRITDLVKKIS